MKLYEIKSKYDALFELYNSTDDEAEREEILAQLNNAEESLDQKLESCCRYIRNLQSEIAAIDDEIERLKCRKLSRQKAEQRFSAYIGHILGCGNKWESTLFTLSWRRSEFVSIDNEQIVPAQYMRETISYDVDKELAKEKLKSGEVIPGLSLAVKNNLQMK